MKKSLVIVSFAFIFLLTISIVSVSAGLWITGDVQSSKAGAKVTPTEINERDSGTTFTRTAGVSAASSQRRSSIPNSWTAVKRADGEGDCYLPPKKSKGLFRRR